MLRIIMKAVYLPKEIIGSRKDIIVSSNGSEELTDRSPELMNQMPVMGSPEFDEVIQLYGVELPETPPRNFLKAYQCLLSNSIEGRVPWEVCVPQKAFKLSVDGLVEAITKKVLTLDLEYYERWYKQGNYVLEKIQPIKINAKIFDNLSNQFSDKVLASFAPNASGYAERVEYTRTGTITGRLKVTSGANILLLNKDYRGIIDSSFGNEGIVLSYDYKSMEPRLILIEHHLSGTLPYKGEEEDIYSLIKSKLFQDNEAVTRDIVKTCVTSALYGASISTLEETYPSVDFKRIIPQINDFFGVAEIKERLENEALMNGNLFLNNRYGRRVSIGDASKYMFVNRYTQSTAVDVCLLGFSSIVKFIEEYGLADFAKPIAVIHDALLLDIHKNAFHLIPAIRKVGAVEIPKYEDSIFYMKSEKIK